MFPGGGMWQDFFFLIFLFGFFFFFLFGFFIAKICIRIIYGWVDQPNQ